MNLQEFINLRQNCPMCETSLVSRFIMDRHQPLKMENGRLVAIKTMKSLKNYQHDYKIGYSFGLTDNTFQIEFYTEWDTSICVPLHLIDKFKEFHHNMHDNFYFARQCVFCNKYESYSNEIILNLKNLTFGNLSLKFEIFMFATRLDDSWRVMELQNNYAEQKSYLALGKPTSMTTESSIGIRNGVSGKWSELPLIPFVSKEETKERLQNLICFY